MSTLVKAQCKDARISAQKARLVVDQIRGLSTKKASHILAFSTKKAAVFVLKVLKSAVANAEHNLGLDIDELKVAKIFVDEAPRLRRFMARAKGRGNRIQRQNCHITVFVESQNEG